MNVETIVTRRVRITPNGQIGAPYVEAEVRPEGARIVLRQRLFDPGFTLDVVAIHFTQSTEIFALMDALRVMGERLRDEEVAAAARTPVSPPAATPSDEHPQGGSR